MTQLSLMELAKQGDADAIAGLINRSLASKGIKAKAELEGECLKISLYALQVPNQKAVITIIHRGMAILQIEQIKRVKILTYRSDNNYLAWQHEIVLDSNLNQSLPTTQIAKSADLEQEHIMSDPTISDQEMNLVNNPKGIILVKKLSQLQQNLQAYQDIIVRFTDEQVGTVRCLTTLTELIQVISKPSFLFAAVASNPNLRSLLDTIADFSKTDEHGDQLITNLSILQPGQQWQKAKIRLVTKIFLEPAQETENTKEKHEGITLDLEETLPQPASSPDLEVAKPEIAKPEIFKVDAPQVNVNAEISEPDLDFKSNAESLTSDALFDDFSEPSLPTSQVIPVINDVTDNSNSSDSLFDDFPESSLSPLQEIPVINDVADNSNSSDSLFDDFSLSTSPVVPVINHVTDNSISSDSLFDNFSESSLPTSQEIPVINDGADNSNSSDSLFDDFSQSSLPTSQVVPVINDVTDNSSSSDSLFDEFMEVSSFNSYSETSNSEPSKVDEDFLTNQVVHQVDDQTKPIEGDGDLFDDFGLGERAPAVNSLESDVTEIESNIDAIKSRIPKQNLDELLMLMAEEEQIKTELEIIENKDIAAEDKNVALEANPLNSDMGATTIERILGNMKTINLKGSEPISSADFVTLEELSEDMNSIGF